MIEFSITKKMPSLNEIYSQKHWSARKKTVDTYHDLFCKYLLPFKQNNKFDEFGVALVYRSRIDADNAVMAIKLLVDSLRKMGMVKNDDSRYFTFITIQKNKQLPHNTYQFKIFAL